ncbi:MAG: PEP-CTERM sorting domain-containing protein, partial [Gemmatimonadota bacterium]
TFNFQVTGHWDPRTSDISILSYDAETHQVSDNWTGNTPGGQVGIAATVTPEPVTMTLLATGIAGMSGAGFLRRRRKSSDIS